MARQPMSERWRSGMVLLVSALLFVGIVAVGPGDELAAFRRTIGLGGDPLGYPADVPAGGTYAFLQHQPGNKEDPVTWDPCREIRYEINPAGAPGGDDDAINLVRQAVATVSDISGLQFAYDGTTQRRPQWETRWTPVGRSEPVLISWATEDEVPQLKGNVAGIGGSVARSIGTNARAHYVTGGVTLDIDSFADIDDRDRSAIVLHELGHVLGLDHVESSDELMYADNLGRTRFGTGDLNGLVRLGQGSCG